MISRFAVARWLDIARALILGIAFYPAASWAIVNIGDDVELEGFVKLQNAFREAKFFDPELIMQRNTAQLEGKYYFLRDSEAFGRFRTGKLEEATLTLIGRGVYDSVYDIRDRYDDVSGDNTELTLREAFVDMVVPPFTLRLGRQQVVWGETDNFRALDIINPLDLRWHWSLEPWEDIRIPLWMARGIYDIGKIGPLEESFIELIWNPGDFKPTRIESDPRRPWAFYGVGEKEIANTVVIDDEIYDLDLDIRDRRPGKKLKNGQGGFRFKGIWGGIDFSLNYFYGYSATAGAKLRSDLVEIENNTYRSVVERVYPRTHVFGFTANYTDERFTQSVFRLETTFSKGIPVSVASEADPDQFDTIRQSVVMLAMDRPTWIRSLNNLRTFFITTQFFWRRHLDYSSHYLGVPAVVPATVGGTVLPGRFVTQNTNRLDRNEFVLTFAASTIYGIAGQWKPLFVFALDPRSTGAYNKLSLEYLWSKHLVLKLEQNIYWRANGREQGPWSIGDLWGRPGDRRSETVFSFTFQF